MLATLLVPWPRPRLSSDRGAIASPSRCCLLISNASCGLGGFGCAAHTVRKMSLRSPQSRRTYAGLRSWSLDRHQRPIHVLRSRCHGSVPFDPASPLRKERMVRTVPRHRTSSLAATIADFCNKIGGEFNESTQHLLILADEEVCEWRGMHGHGSRRNRRLSCGSAGRAVNVWRTSRERLRGGTKAASIGSWLAMEGLLQRHAGGLW